MRGCYALVCDLFSGLRNKSHPSVGVGFSWVVCGRLQTCIAWFCLMCCWDVDQYVISSSSSAARAADDVLVNIPIHDDVVLVTAVLFSIFVSCVIFFASSVASFIQSSPVFHLTSMNRDWFSSMDCSGRAFQAKKEFGHHHKCYLHLLIILIRDLENSQIPPKHLQVSDFVFILRILNPIFARVERMNWNL